MIALETKWKLKRDYIEFLLKTIKYKWRIKKEYAKIRLSRRW